MGNIAHDAGDVYLPRSSCAGNLSRTATQQIASVPAGATDYSLSALPVVSILSPLLLDEFLGLAVTSYIQNEANIR